MGKTLVYHGSYAAIARPEIIPGRHAKDFGPGFYCTVIREQAARWARRYPTPTLNLYSALIDEKLDVLEFPAMSDAWLDFIVACRAGRPHGHDVVVGAMADDQIYNYVADFIEGIVTREQFWALAKFKYPTHQMAFCTPRALSCLTFIRAEKLS